MRPVYTLLAIAATASATAVIFDAAPRQLDGVSQIDLHIRSLFHDKRQGCQGTRFENSYCCSSSTYCFNGEVCCDNGFCCPGGSICLESTFQCSGRGDGFGTGISAVTSATETQTRTTSSSQPRAGSLTTITATITVEYISYFITTLTSSPLLTSREEAITTTIRGLGSDEAAAQSQIASRSSAIEDIYTSSAMAASSALAAVVGGTASRVSTTRTTSGSGIASATSASTGGTALGGAVQSASYDWALCTAGILMATISAIGAVML
ncbi:Endochitinase [Sphaceloma murrayae]|uniref:Endochitinase n=1 Tax=Sphaceloma murrayae TaxID=2082308 RepID=A0A2K1QUS4_9PEZI|nr:Endochitinase [Sphaceloma murrayae]